MDTSSLDIDKQKKYDELKKQYLNKSSNIIPDESSVENSHSEIISNLENQLKQKRSTLKELNSNDLLHDLNTKKKQLDDNINSKKQHIQDLRLNLQLLQKEIMHTIQEIKTTTEQKTTELYTTTNQLSELSAEENELIEKIQNAQKLRVSQEKELEAIRLERLNIVNKNKDTQKIQEQILQSRNRLDQINSDRSMLELEIKSQMNLLEEERDKEREIISRIIRQNKN